MCTKTVMDTTDPDIWFDEDGVSNHVYYFENEVKPRWFPNEEGKSRLAQIVAGIKSENADNEYDCIVGLSGGADSSYLALKIKELGLRPLVVHVDGGWNSELSVSNIEKIVNYCEWDLETCVIDWPEMRDLQVSFIKSGIANQDVPQDHAFFAALYSYAVQNKIKYVLSGGNFATECIFPKAWHHSAMDSRSLKSIHHKYGTIKLKYFPTVSFLQYYFYFPFIKRMKVVRPLNFMPYRRSDAIRELEETIGWRNYGRKHGESVFTKFFQNYYLPQRFGYDKRKPHLSSMILAGEISRAEALRELEKPLYDENELKEDMLYVTKKLGFSKEEFVNLMHEPVRTYADFPSDEAKYVMMKKLQSFIQNLFGKDLASYS
ncbi:MAG: N-acetyl sugar amidotransferase [Sedimentisphaerales bacterium]|nr:N-acetyl sugar amidotransferase [Sedimentisphaerales bacterium]